MVRHEFKASFKTMRILLIGIAIMDVIMLLQTQNIKERLSYYDERVSLAAFVAITGSIFLFSFALLLGTLFFYFTSAMNKRIYGPEGYLTLTLPTSTCQIMVSRLLVGLIWFGIAIALTVVSATILYLPSASELYQYSGYHTIIELLVVSIMEDPGGYLNAFFQFTIGVLYFVSLIWFVNAFTHTGVVRGHRGLVAFVMFFVIAFGLSTIFNNMGISFDSNVSFLNATTIYDAILALIFFSLTWYCLDKKVELD
jgi:hypothetical protein